jgi:alpha-beta hydrolase superfamily lysophospholipase
MGATRVARALAAFAVTVLLVWLALPIARAYLLVAGHSADVPAPQDLPFEEVRFSPDDGTDLDGWFLRAAGEAPAVVLVHGFKSSRLEMIPWARFLHAAGYGVLLFDTRACGKSGGRTVGLGATEARDVSAAVSQVRSTARTTKVAVLGVSLGAGAAILAAADDPSITAVVADSAWTDQDFQLARLLFVQAGPLRVPLPPYGIAAVDMLVGANVESARPLECDQADRTPTHPAHPLRR